MGSRVRFAVIALTGLLLVWKFYTPDIASPSPKPQALSTTPSQIDKKPEYLALLQRIDQLEDELNQQNTGYTSLEQRVRQLEVQTANDTINSVQNEAVDTTESPPPDDNNTQNQTDNDLESNLINMGMTLETAQAIRQRVDQNQLEMLQLRNTAFREGWEDSPEFSEKMQELGNSFRGLRGEFGDEDYDRYLYASGMPNRVVVREVFSGSAADSAGIQPGDVITRYASENIYSMSSLRQATLQGSAGETILIETERDGRRYSSSLPRGPLGISMTMKRVEPE